jgi:hypothetical protein
MLMPFSHSSLFQSKYNTIIKWCYYEGKEIPPIELIAEEIGCTVTRLKTAIPATQQSRSLDELMNLLWAKVSELVLRVVT